jgi:hypothetical protein
LVAYEEAAKWVKALLGPTLVLVQLTNLDGASSSSSLLMCRVSSHTFVDVEGACLCWCVWSDSTTIVNNVMDKLSPSLIDKLTFCNNYLYSCGKVIFILVDKLSYDVYFVSKDMCVDCACMSKWKQWEIGLTSQWGHTQRRQGFTNLHLLSSQRRHGLTNLYLICSLSPWSRYMAVKSAIRL